MNDVYLTMRITIQDEEADDNYLERLTIRLMNELRDLDFVEVNRIQQVDKDSTKGESFTIGLLLLAILPSALPQIINLLQYWTGERRRISIETASGVKVEFIPDKSYSEEEILSLIDKLSISNSNQSDVN